MRYSKDYMTKEIMKELELEAQLEREMGNEPRDPDAPGQDDEEGEVEVTEEDND